jgi:MmyB-like transcription regulator ligand binding domain
VAVPGGVRAADDTVGILRARAGRNPYDKGLTDLVGELSTRSEEVGCPQAPA